MKVLIICFYIPIYCEGELTGSKDKIYFTVEIVLVYNMAVVYTLQIEAVLKSEKHSTNFCAF